MVREDGEVNQHGAIPINAAQGNSTTANESLLTTQLPYPIAVQRGLLHNVAAVAEQQAPAYRYAIIIDENVLQHHGHVLHAAFQRQRALFLTVPSGEREKSRERWCTLTDALLEWGAGRDTTIIAIGGGVVCDLAGFVAATFMRGIPVVQVPTTLLAMVDASVGGKTGVDTIHGKNFVGAFHNPSAVIVDPDVLTTLPAPIFRSGLAEMIKHGVLASAEYFHRLNHSLPQLASPNGARDQTLTTLIADSIAIKATIVHEDPRENGRRATLNFGHTIAHAIEKQAGFDMLHGDAVAIGMVVETSIATQLGIAPPELRKHVQNTMVAAGLPHTLPVGLSPQAIVNDTHSDKKVLAGAVRYALPAALGIMARDGGRWSIAVPDDVALNALQARLD